MLFQWILLLISLLLVACGGKQPTEVQKAQIEKNLLVCLIATTTQVGIDEGPIVKIFGALATLGSNLTKGISNRSWRVSDAPGEVITMSLTAENTRYECDYIEKTSEDSNWTLIEVRRNDEVVFNLEDDLVAKQEEARLQEAKRVEQNQEWTEKSYGNVSYKYYEKNHMDTELNSYSSVTIKVVCNPDFARFEYDRSFSMSDRREVSFTFLGDGDEITKDFDLTSNGRIGEYKESAFSNEVYSSQIKTEEFLALLKAADAIKVDGFTFTTDDLTQIPCLMRSAFESAAEGISESLSSAFGGDADSDQEQQELDDEGPQERQGEDPAKALYIAEYLELYDVSAEYKESMFDGTVPGVTFKIRNGGDRSLDKVEVTIYFKDEQGNVIFEEDYNPVLVTKYSISGDGKPLKPGYIWQMERSKFYSAEQVPNEWKEGNIDASITEIRFSE